MKSAAASARPEQLTRDPESWPHGASPRDTVAARRRRRDLAREYPRFLIRLVGEERLQRLPAESLLPHRYD